MNTRTNIRIMLALILLLCSFRSCHAANPSLTWQIDVSGGVKTYTYTLLNDAGLGPIWELDIYMPVAGSSSITSFTCSNASFDAWIVPGIAEVGSDFTGLDAGESMQIWLQTPVDVPTVYDYHYSQITYGNWWWINDYDTEPGSTSIPVPGPVPEPSCLLALGCGLAGLGGLVRQRKKE